MTRTDACGGWHARSGTWEIAQLTTASYPGEDLLIVLANQTDRRHKLKLSRHIQQASIQHPSQAHIGPDLCPDTQEHEGQISAGHPLFFFLGPLMTLLASDVLH